MAILNIHALHVLQTGPRTGTPIRDLILRGTNPVPPGKLRSGVRELIRIMGDDGASVADRGAALEWLRDGLDTIGETIPDLLSAAREAVDLSDWVQDVVIRRAAELSLTAYRIAQLTEGRVSEDHVQAYLTRRKSCGSHKLQHILRVLGLEIRTTG